SSTEGIPLSITAEAIGIEEGDVSESYFRYKSVVSSDPEYGQSLENYFSPAIDKWVKADDDASEDEEEPSSFIDQGAMAAFDAIAIFAPITHLSDADREIFFATVDKYNLYQVGEEIENARFKGVEARKVRVSVQEDAFTEFEREASEALSDEANYRKFDSTYTNHLFGKTNSLAADVYIHPETANIIGVDLRIDLSEPIDENAYGTKLDKINTSLLIEYDRET